MWLEISLVLVIGFMGHFLTSWLHFTDRTHTNTTVSTVVTGWRLPNWTRPFVSGLTSSPAGDHLLLASGQNEVRARNWPHREHHISSLLFSDGSGTAECTFPWLSHSNCHPSRHNILTADYWLCHRVRLSLITSSIISELEFLTLSERISVGPIHKAAAVPAKPRSSQKFKAAL
jgi:hypothetical protein